MHHQLDDLGGIVQNIPDIIVQLTTMQIARFRSSVNFLKAFTSIRQDLETPQNYIVAPVHPGYPLTADVQVVSVAEFT